LQQRVLIIGGSGMVGTNLADALLRQGDNVTILSRPGANRWRLAAFPSQLNVVEIDYLQGVGIERIVRKSRPDVIFHLASAPFNPPSITANEHFGVNVALTAHLLDTIRETLPETRFIFAGSCAAYGEGNDLQEDAFPSPKTILGAAKQSARLLLEVYAELYGLRTQNLCLFTPFGPWESRNRLIPHIILSALEGRSIEMTEGLQQRDFLYIDDVVDAFMRAAVSEVPGGTTINICSGTPIQVRELACMLLDIMGGNVELKFGALPTRSDEIRIISGNNRRASDILDWRPKHSLREALELTVSWFQNNKSLYI
jgi:nucleoside-diphosphate-sugar epimerase